MGENSTAAIKVGNELVAGFKSNQELSRVMFCPHYMDQFDAFCLRSTGKVMGDHGIRWGGGKLYWN